MSFFHVVRVAEGILHGAAYRLALHRSKMPGAIIYSRHRLVEQHAKPRARGYEPAGIEAKVIAVAGQVGAKFGARAFCIAVPTGITPANSGLSARALRIDATIARYIVIWSLP